MLDEPSNDSQLESPGVFQRAETWMFLGAVLGAASVGCYQIGRRLQVTDGTIDAEYEED